MSETAFDIGFIVTCLIGWAGIAYGLWSWVIRKDQEELIGDLIRENNAHKRTIEMLQETVTRIT